MHTILDLIANNKEWIFSGIGLFILAPIFKIIATVFLGRTKRSSGFKGAWDILLSDQLFGHMRLQQFGPIVWGNAYTQNLGKDGEVDRRRYKYRGFSYSDQAVLRFHEVGQNSRIVGATVLRLMRNDNQISGGNIFWHHDKAEIREEKYMLKRNH